MTKMFRILVPLACLSAFAACGGDDSGGGNNTPDAGNAMPDANNNAALIGLGQTCSATATCDTSAPDCLAAPMATTGFCSVTCGDNVQVMSNAMGQIPIYTAGNATCENAFQGSVGTPVCGIITDGLTAQPEPNMTYTVTIACGVVCGAGNACPGDLTCNSNGLCVP